LARNAGDDGFQTGFLQSMNNFFILIHDFNVNAISSISINIFIN
jgi:hypothetical protein